MDIDKFKQQFNDILRTNRFMIEMFPPDKVRENTNLELVNCMSVSCNFPFGKIIEKEKLRYGKKHKIATNWDLDPITITFLCESKGRILDFFKKWKDVVVDSENLMSYYNEYAGRINVMMLDVQEQNIFEAELINAFPASIESINMDMESTDLMKVQVSIVFSDVKYIHNGEKYEDVVYVEPERKEYASMDIADISKRNILTNIDSNLLRKLSGKINDKISSFISDKVNKINFEKLNKTVDLPIVGAVDINIGNFLESKTKEITSRLESEIKQTVDNKLSDAQRSFNEKYAEKLNDKLNSLTSSMQNKVSKIFSF